MTTSGRSAGDHSLAARGQLFRYASVRDPPEAWLRSARHIAKCLKRLRAAGIGVNLHYIPVHRQPYYEGLGFKAGYCPEAEQYYAEAISLPMYPGLTDKRS